MRWGRRRIVGVRHFNRPILRHWRRLVSIPCRRGPGALLRWISVLMLRWLWAIVLLLRWTQRLLSCKWLLRIAMLWLLIACIRVGSRCIAVWIYRTTRALRLICSRIVSLLRRLRSVLRRVILWVVSRHLLLAWALGRLRILPWIVRWLRSRLR